MIQAENRQLQDPAHPDDMRETLARVGDEVGRLAASAEKIQHALGDIIATSKADQASSTYDLQILDEHTQALDAIAHFLTALSEQADGAWRIDAKSAAHAITLKNLALRLTAGRDAALAEEPARDGDCLFF